MKKLLPTLAILLIATASYAQKLYHEEKFKISIPFGNDIDESVKKRMSNKADKYISQAAEYEYQAEAELSSRGKLYYKNSVPGYDKAISLYESAVKDSKYALDKIFEKQKKKKVKADIRRLGDIIYSLKKDRKILHQKIEPAIKDKKIVLGMTESDVGKSIGRPVRIDTVAGLKKAVYNRSITGRQQHLYFYSGILIETEWSSYW